MADPIAVLIVDDQPLQRAGFRMVLESQPDITIVGEVGDGAQALSRARRDRIDVIVMDIRMPRVNGIVATERITTDPQVLALGAAPRVILLTALELETQIPEAARVGAFAVLYKDVEPEALLEAVRGAAVARGPH